MIGDTDTSWVVKGAQVAELSGRGYSDSVSLSTIERLTKTQIVLANGHRYNRRYLRKVGDDFYRTELLPADHWRVLDVLASRIVSNLRYGVEKSGKNQKITRKTALDAIEQIEALAAEARSKFEKLPNERQVSE